MVIILPDEIDGLAEFENMAWSVDFFDQLKHFDKTTVTVALPRFKLEKTMNLRTILMSVSE